MYSECVESYLDNVDIDLMVFALRNYNEEFLKHSLAGGLFTLEMLQSDEAKEEIFLLLE